MSRDEEVAELVLRHHREHRIGSWREWQVVQQLDAKLKAYERDLPPLDVVRTLASETVREEGWARYAMEEDSRGSPLPWRKLLSKLRLRDGEMTIWAGPNGSLKSATVNFVLGTLAIQRNESSFIASMEMTLPDQVARLARQMLAEPRGTPELRGAFDELMGKLDDKIMLYDYVGQLKPTRVVALARYAAVELRARHILIDNLTMVVPPGKDTDEQGARFVAGLYQVGRDTGSHIHLIAHVRKPDGSGRILNRYDIRGTGSAPDMVDNVVMLQMNELKRLARDRNELTDVMAREPDITMHVDKQRHGWYVGLQNFWIHPPTLRLLESGIEVPERIV